jgi:phosphotransacetylase
MKKDGGLRTERRLSHCFVMAVPTYARAVIVSDAAINIMPTLEEKADIVQNAIELAHAVGVAQPKVAIQECREFRVGAMTMRAKETSYGTTQTACYSRSTSRPTAGRHRREDGVREGRPAG